MDPAPLVPYVAPPDLRANALKSVIFESLRTTMACGACAICTDGIRSFDGSKGIFRRTLGEIAIGPWLLTRIVRGSMPPTSVTVPLVEESLNVTASKVQKRSKQRVFVPTYDELTRAISLAKRDSVRVLTDARGMPWNPHTFRHRFKDAAEPLGSRRRSRLWNSGISG